MNNSIFALITAAGKSSRMGGIKKELIRINNKPLIYHSVLSFIKTGMFKSIFITCQPEMENLFSEALSDIEMTYKSMIRYIRGGETRQASVFEGLKAMKSFNPGFVLIHDGARPFVSQKIIMDVINGTLKHGACAPVVPVVDSIKIVKNDLIMSHPDRSNYKAIQTPQGFGYQAILESHLKASGQDLTYNDDTEIFSIYNGSVFTIHGSAENVKITYPDDLKNISGYKGSDSMDKVSGIRTGQGYDIHRLSEGRPLIIGGVSIESEKGAVAHSDGDVLYHAIIDSLFGAVSDGDIGSHFPPSNPVYKNIRSEELLRKTYSVIKEKGYSILNIDTTVILEKPRLREYIDLMRKNISDILETDIDSISVKAKTKEKCDASGEGNAVEAYSSALLIKKAAH